MSGVLPPAEREPHAAVLSKFIRQEKRGGVRRPIRKSAVIATNSTDYYTPNTKCQLPNKLIDLRFLICTDMSPADILFLMVFTFWIKKNEATFHKRNNYPIYGFMTRTVSDGSSSGTDRTEKAQPPGEVGVVPKAQQMATEYMEYLGDLMGWNDPESHLYQKWRTALTPITDLAQITCKKEHICVIDLIGTKSDRTYQGFYTLTRDPTAGGGFFTGTNASWLFNELQTIAGNADFGPFGNFLDYMHQYNDSMIEEIRQVIGDLNPESKDSILAAAAKMPADHPLKAQALPLLENGSCIESGPMILAFKLLQLGGCQISKNYQKMFSQGLNLL